MSLKLCLRHSFIENVHDHSFLAKLCLADSFIDNTNCTVHNVEAMRHA